MPRRRRTCSPALRDDEHHPLRRPLRPTAAAGWPHTPSRSALGAELVSAALEAHRDRNAPARRPCSSDTYQGTAQPPLFAVMTTCEDDQPCPRRRPAPATNRSLIVISSLADRIDLSRDPRDDARRPGVVGFDPAPSRTAPVCISPHSGAAASVGRSLPLRRYVRWRQHAGADPVIVAYVAIMAGRLARIERALRERDDRGGGPQR